MSNFNSSSHKGKFICRAQFVHKAIQTATIQSVLLTCFTHKYMKKPGYELSAFQNKCFVFENIKPSPFFSFFFSSLASKRPLIKRVESEAIDGRYSTFGKMTKQSTQKILVLVQKYSLGVTLLTTVFLHCS